MKQYIAAVGVVAFTTAGCLALRAHLQTTDVAMVLLLGVVLVASSYRRGPALVASLLSIAAFDFLFVPPYYTFAVRESAYLLTFGVMLAVALLMARLTARIREQAGEARARERRTAALYALSRDLAGAGDRAGQVAIAARHIGRAAGGEAVVVLVDEVGLEGGVPRWPATEPFDNLAVRVAADWAYRHGESAGQGTAHCAAAEAFAAPLRAAAGTLGVVVVPRLAAEGPLSQAERETVEALADQAGVTLERALLAERHERARVEVEAERLRTALLSSLSHDLRTPLASIEGAASSLLEDLGTLPPEVQRDLAETVLEESRRMSRLVANLLDMIRVETGMLAVRKAWQPLEEALGVALLRLEDRLKDHPLETRLPDDLPLVPIDELLIEQIFINLLENAAKYTPPGTPITIGAWADGDAVVVEVADRGPGVPAGLEEAVFRKFYRAAGDGRGAPPAEAGGGAGAGAGAGLGLTICRGIVSAHGGRIWVEQRPGGGAAFRFSLPLDGPPPGPASAAGCED